MYNSFNKTKNKLSKIWDKVNNNTLYLKNFLFPSNNITGQQEYFKNPFILYDSEWIADSVNFNTESDIKNEFRPGSISYDINQELEIPERFLPFIEPVILTKGTPDVKFISDLTVKSTSYNSDFYEIKGDGELIYQGIEFTTNALFPQSSLDEGRFLESHTKKLWEMTLEYTDGGEFFRIKGTVGRIILEKDQGTGCNGNSQNDTYEIDADEIFGSYDNEHRFINFTSISDTSIDIEFIGDLFEERWVFNDPNCDFESTVFNSIHETKNIPNDADNFYSIRFGIDAIKYTLDEPNGSIIDSESFGLDTFINTTVDTVTKINTEFLGYKLYYSTDTIFRAGIITQSGQKILTNLPETSSGLPYSEITFKRNPVNKPEAVTSDITLALHKNKVWLKTSKTTDTKDSFNININGTLYVLAKATEEVFITRQVYNDIYTSDGGSPVETYERTTTDHDTKDLPLYIPIDSDIQMRIMLVLKNPLYWNEIKNYIINET